MTYKVHEFELFRSGNKFCAIAKLGINRVIIALKIIQEDGESPFVQWPSHTFRTDKGPVDIPDVEVPKYLCRDINKEMLRLYGVLKMRHEGAKNVK